MIGMMKNVWLLASCIAVTTNAFICTYSGEDYNIIGTFEDGSLNEYRGSWNYNSGASSVLKLYAYTRNATMDYTEQYAYAYNEDETYAGGQNWALESGYLSAVYPTENQEGDFGYGVNVKGNWEDKIEQFETKTNNPVVMIPGVEISYEALWNNPEMRSDANERKINGYDVFGIDFGGMLQHEMVFTLSDLGPGEIASYRAYNQGVRVDVGTVEGNALQFVEFVISSSSGYDTVELFVANDHISSTMYLVQRVEYCAPKSCDRTTMDVGKVFGDPHIQSFDGYEWDCMGTGHFQTFLGQEKETKDTVFEIQSIFTKSSHFGKQMTVTDAIVIDSVEEGVPKLTIAAKTSTAGDCSYAIYDSLQEVVVDHTIAKPFNTSAIFLKVVEPRSGRKYELLEFSYLSTHTDVEITLSSLSGSNCFLSVAVCLGDGYWETEEVITTGLLGGKADGNQANDWLTQDGDVVPISSVNEDAFNFCVDNWCIQEQNKSKSKFTYDPQILHGNFEYYDECTEVYDPALSCDDVLTNPAYAVQVQVCNTFETSITECDGTLDQCYAEGCNGGTDGIAAFIVNTCELNDMTAGEGIYEEVYAAGGIKFTFEPTSATPSPSSAPLYSQAGGVSGDPHFKTWSGQKYDYHGICDLVLLSHPDFHGGLGLAIHIRSKKTKQWSYISTAVVLIGRETFEVAGLKDGNTHWLNMVGVEKDEWDQNSVQIVGFPVKVEQSHANQRNYEIGLGDDEYIKMKTWKNMVRVDIVVNHGKDTFDGSLGLMGSYPEGTMLGRDGKTSLVDLNKFGQEWQVLSSESKLFHVVDGPQHPSKCDVPGKTTMRRRLARSDISREEAEIACSRAGVGEEEFNLCVFDVMAIGDKSAAGAY